MDPCPERESISKFQCANHNGAKYAKQCVLELFLDPTHLTQYSEGGRTTLGKIVVSREQVFHCIDEWHRDNGHMGQERTWGYCKEKYYNVRSALLA